MENDRGVAARGADPTPKPENAARVVVVEDDDDMRALVVDALRRDGYRVTDLANGAELLIRLAHQYRRLNPAERVELIVSDIRMPVITGLQILRGLREARCPTPVILMTAFGDPATRREAEALGAVLIDKPLSLATLRAEARRLLDVAEKRR